MIVNTFSMDSDKQKLTDDFHRLLYRMERYLRLEAVDKLTVVSSCLIVSAVVFALGTSAVFFLSTGLVKTVTLLTGNEMMSYYVVGVVLLLLIVVFYSMRKRLVESRMVKLFSHSLLDGQTFTELYAGKPGKDKDSLRRLAESLAHEIGDYDEEGGEL